MHRAMRQGVVLLCVCLTTHAAPALAQEASPALDRIEELRQQLEALRQDYEARLTALETRLQELQAAEAVPTPPTPEPAPPQQPPAASAAVPAGAAGASGPTGGLPVYGAATPASKIFNPDIAVVGTFSGAAGSNRIAPRTSLNFEEAEASFQAIVDPYARADFFLAFTPEEVEVEEGYLTFPALPGGLLIKAGKLKNAFGKVNTFHTHQFTTIDRPLLMESLLGGEEGIADAGVSVSRLLPNPWLFLEATGEIYRGESGVFVPEKRSDLSFLGRLRGYGDLTESANLDLGVSYLTGKNELGSAFRTSLVGVDATFRYRPLRRAIYRRFLARTELVWRRTEREDGRGDAFGAYVQADYQFTRRWFLGLRYDRAERADDPALRDDGQSAILTYWPSEFSQVRGQYRRTRYAEGETANEFLFQLQFSIGAHGAHVF